MSPSSHLLGIVIYRSSLGSHMAFLMTKTESAIPDRVTGLTYVAGQGERRRQQSCIRTRGVTNHTVTCRVCTDSALCCSSESSDVAYMPLLPRAISYYARLDVTLRGV